jgi:hypothetical protein
MRLCRYSSGIREKDYRYTRRSMTYVFATVPSAYSRPACIRVRPQSSQGFFMLIRRDCIVPASPVNIAIPVLSKTEGIVHFP